MARPGWGDDFSPARPGRRGGHSPKEYVMPESPPAPPAAVSVGRRLSGLAAIHPDRAAIIFAPADGPEERISWRDLDEASNRFARLLAARGVGEHATVVVGLPNSPAHLV